MKIQWHRFCLFFLLNSFLVGLFVLIYWHLTGEPTLPASPTWEEGRSLILLFSFTCLLLCLISLIEYITIYSDEKKLIHWLTSIKKRAFRSDVYRPHFTSFYLNSEAIQSLLEISEKLEEQQQLLSQEQMKAPRLAQQSEEAIITEERHRIAREIHDSVSQDLFALTMLLGTLQLLDPKDEQYQKIFMQVNKLSMQAQNELRALLLHLRPLALAKRSLKAGIAHLFSELQSKVNVAFETSLEEVQLPSAFEDHLFRIVQELLSNALRHSHAGLIRCELRDESERVVLNFSDDGQGFDVEAARQNSGYGLKNIAERMDDMAGHMQIISKEGYGTQIRLYVPKFQTEEEKQRDKSTDH